MALGVFLGIGVFISTVVELLHAGLVDLAVEHSRVQAAKADRELLLNELAHRTRNDLSNVVILLNLQSKEASPEARAILDAATSRVQAIARVHRQLGLRGSHVVVDSKSYIGELCDDLKHSRLAMRQVAIECFAESHPIDIEKAIPIGLIVNESVTNAVKHAFPHDRPGLITVSFTRINDRYRLAITDNGEGSAPPAGSRQGMGNRLMQMLAGQLGSSLQTTAGPDGTSVVIDIAVRTAPMPNEG